MATSLVRSILSASVIAALLLEATPAAAQLEEIIVTARKREESIMKVPVVATTIAAEQLQQFALDDLTSIADLVPGLVLGTGTLMFGDQVSLRGIGTSVLNATVDQSISLNVDGLQLTQGLAYQSAMFDMAGIEVLKGPQALFFGKGSPGGVIAVKTADPTDDFDFSVGGGYEFEAEEAQMEMIVSGPVTDTLGVRLAGQFSDAEGYFSNDAVAAPGTGARAPDDDTLPQTETTLLRGTVLWNPTERFNSRLKLNYSESDTEGTGGEPQMGSCPEGTASITGTATFLGGGEDCKLDDTYRYVYLDPAAFPAVKNGGTPYANTEQNYGTLELNYDLGNDLALTSVTGYYDLDQGVMINGTAATYYGPLIVSQNEFGRDDITEELRLTSDYDGPVNFILGAFYQDASMDLSIDVPGNTALRLPARLALADHEVEIEAMSVFGQVLWDITDQLELGAGARWTDEDRSHTMYDLMSGTPKLVPLADPEMTSNDISPEVTLTWTPTDDLTVFGAVKKGYKSGSYNTTGAFLPGEDNSFDDEKVTGGETGVKLRLLDGSLMANVAAYYYEYDDMQVGASDIENPLTLAVKTVNAASSEIYGVEADALYAVPGVEGLTLRAALNWNQAQYEEFEDSICWGGQRIQDGCDQLYDPVKKVYTAQDLSDGELMRAPDWQGNAGLDYEMALTDGMSLVLGWTTTYSGDYYTNILLRDDMVQDSYFKHSASVALQAHDEAWVVQLIGNNLSDEITTGNCSQGNFANGGPISPLPSGTPERGPGGVDELSCLTDPGRAVWLKLTLRPALLMD